MPKLTKTAIDSAQPAKHDVWLWDHELPGFGVRIQPSGRKTYVVRYRNKKGQQRKHTIARTCDMPPQQARDLARRVFAEVAAGGDPAVEKRDAKQAATLDDLFERYLTEHARAYKKPTTIRQDIRNYRTYASPVLGHMNILTVTHYDVTRLHTSLRHISITANRTLSVVSSIFKWAEKMDLMPRGSNPCTGLKNFPERKREKILSKEQIEVMYRCLDSGRYPPEFCTFVRLVLLTGCRKSEILNARREWVDFERGLLILPDTKTGPRTVSLSAAALQILKTGTSEYIVPGPRNRRPMANLYKHWWRLVKEADVEGTRIHDLRHTVGSMAHRAGLSQRQVADLLGHRRLSTTERYIHGTVIDRANAAEVIAKLMA